METITLARSDAVVGPGNIMDFWFDPESSPCPQRCLDILKFAVLSNVDQPLDVLRVSNADGSSVAFLVIVADDVFYSGCGFNLDGSSDGMHAYRGADALLRVLNIPVIIDSEGLPLESLESRPEDLIQSLSLHVASVLASGSSVTPIRLRGRTCHGHGDAFYL